MKALVIKNADFSANSFDQVVFDVIHAESISISPSTLALSAIGATAQLSYTVVPNNAEDPIRFTSSNENVATVTNNGLVTVTGVGSATITVTAGAVSAACALTVIVPLTDNFIRAIQTQINASNDTNTVTDVTTYYNYGVWYKAWMSLVRTDDTHAALPIPIQFVDVSVNPAVMQSQEWLDENRPYSKLGWMIPIKLPQNCTKIRFTALNDNYGVYPTFYKSEVPDTNYGLTAQRKPQAKSSDWTYVFEQVTIVDVPTGYDSFDVSWKYENGEEGAGNFGALSSAELAEFTVEFM